MTPTIVECRVDADKSKYVGNCGAGWTAGFVVVASNFDGRFRDNIGDALSKRLGWEKFTEARGRLVAEALPRHITMELHVIRGQFQAYVTNESLDEIAEAVRKLQD